ncbi:MAG: phage terminase large subunit [Betaproteobacteria bacterium]|nr:phage terminase large subunit [Betaproteobacteria bacterium]
MRRFREDDGSNIVEEVLDFAALWKADSLGFEDGQIWKALEWQFKKRCGERMQYPSWELLKPLTDKLTRASPLKGRMQLGKVYFPNDASWFDACQRELLHFPAGRYDDIVDALAWVVRLTLSRQPPARHVGGAKMKGWRERLLSGRAGGVSHMGA